MLLSCTEEIAHASHQNGSAARAREPSKAVFVLGRPLQSCAELSKDCLER